MAHLATTSSTRVDRRFSGAALPDLVLDSSMSLRVYFKNP